MADVLEIIFPDGAKKEFPAGTTGEDIAGSISSGLKKQAIAVNIDGVAYDLRTPLPNGGAIEIVTLKQEQGVEIMRHSAAHLLAQAVKRLYGNVQFGVGPVIENGFFYDMDLEASITPEDLPKIEKEMQRIVDANLPIVRKVVSREEAKAMFSDIGDKLKLELIDAIPEDQDVTIYEQGEFFDLCRDYHVPSTGKIKVFKLLSISGAYWRGDSKNQMLQRIYGTAFEKKGELDHHLKMLEEAKERDHRKLGKELELFTVSQKVGQGLPLWLPKGATIRRTIERYIVDLEEKLGYDHVLYSCTGKCRAL